MAVTTIDASATALKLSYLRFVSDSAPGLLLVLVFIVLDPKLLPVTIAIPDDTAAKTFVTLAAVLLVTPVGLVINGASHYVLGDLQRRIDEQCFRARGWPVEDTRQVLLVDQWKQFFEIEDGDWPRVAHEVDDYLDTFVPHLAASLDHVRALKKFCRSVAFLALVVALTIAGWWGALATVGLLLAMAIRIVASAIRRTIAVGVCVMFGAVIIAVAAKSIPLAVALLLTTCGALLLAGLIDFYQHGLTMLFTYQLLVQDGSSFRITPAKVRERLADFVRSRMMPPANSPRASD